MEDPRAIIAREPMHYRQVLTVATATALNALDGFDVLSISFASPGIAHDWGITRAALGVVLSMELIGMGIGAFLLGNLADRIGRRPTILTCLVIMGSGMGLASIAGNVMMLSLFRLFTGLGIGGMLAATGAIVAECSNARRRNLAVAIMAIRFSGTNSHTRIRSRAVLSRRVRTGDVSSLPGRRLRLSGLRGRRSQRLHR